MLFVGDIVFPFNSFIKDNFLFNKEFLEIPKFGNLESLILDQDKLNKKTTSGIALYSTIKVIEFLKHFNIVAVSLANNHITDFDISIDDVKTLLAENNIIGVGAGDRLESASVPYVDNEKKVLVLVFGWSGISCKYATKSKPGVNPYIYNYVKKQVKFYREKYKDYSLIIYSHWNYEFELYPFPADRELAFELIDLGADAIIGTHSHIIQGYEIYKSKPIFYGLGNFFIPQTNYFSHNLKYPSLASNGLCIHLNSNYRKIITYKVKYNIGNHSLEKINECKLLKDDFLKKISKFSCISNNEYEKFYQQNRVKKNKFLPIFQNWEYKFINYYKLIFIGLRQIVIDKLILSVKEYLKNAK